VRRRQQRRLAAGDEVKQWAERILFAGSLRRFLLLWLLGGLLAVVASVTLWQAALMHSSLAQAQDERLATALATLVQSVLEERTLLIDAPAYVATRPSGADVLHRIAFRVSTMGADWLAGDQGLPACPWPQALRADGAPDLYVSHLRGALVRVAAARRHVTGERRGTAVIVQAAAPLSERLPAWDALWRVLQPLYVAAAAVAGLMLVGIGGTLSWIARARAALDRPADPSRRYDGPAELKPLVERVQELYRAEHQWVDEQRRFLADASHQLRTPMAVLRAQLQAAIAGDSAAEDMLPQMLHTVDRAAGLANQLLSLTKLEQLKRQGELKPIEVRTVARDAVYEISPLIAAKRIDFTLDDADFTVPADATMLGELVRNLLANAVHHAPPAGRVGIVLRAGAQRCEMIVWDEGPGIDDEVRPRLFHPFSATQGGIGLGLSICRQIAQSMGASVELFNRTEGGQVIGVDAVVAWHQPP
jgi:two-component system, OmpR family, sensor histidine kinase TctE